MALFNLEQEFFDDNDMNHEEYVEEEEEVVVVKVEDKEEKIEVLKDRVVDLQVVLRKIVLKDKVGNVVERWIRRKIEDTEHHNTGFITGRNL